MNLIMIYISLVLFLIIMPLIFIGILYRFLSYPSAKRRKLMEVFLISVALEIEKDHHAKDIGKMKRSYAYQQFIKHYRIFGMFVLESIFDEMLHSAIVEARVLLDKEIEWGCVGCK